MNCRNNEYGCDNQIPDEMEGELCAECEAEYKRVAAYWKARYYAEPRYSREEIIDSLSDATEYAKRVRLLEEKQ